MIRLFFFLFVTFFSHCPATYYSQCAQDKITNENYFKNLRNGVFLDIGAHDGIKFSNTYFFETELDWTGICIEPMPEVFESLQNNRKCRCICGCASPYHNVTKDFFRITGPYEMHSGLVENYDPLHVDRIQRLLNGSKGISSFEILKVTCYNVNLLLEESGISHINFLSIDTEGGELEILQSIDYSKYQIDVIAVEDNYGNPGFLPFMESKGFKYIGRMHQDLLFVNKKSGLL